MRALVLSFLSLVTCVVGFTSVSLAQDSTFKVAEGKLAFTAPKEWTSKKPATRIVDVEFEIPAAEGDERPGRMTVMGAGGSVKDNIDRWFGQFTQTDGKKTADVAKVEKISISNQEVHYVDVAGDFDDKPGPFVPGVKRSNYRMLAAIVVNKDLGQYFLKFYGPKETVAKNEKAFKTMLESLKVNP